MVSCTVCLYNVYFKNIFQNGYSKSLKAFSKICTFLETNILIFFSKKIFNASLVIHSKKINNKTFMISTIHFLIQAKKVWLFFVLFCKNHTKLEPKLFKTFLIKTKIVPEHFLKRVFIL